jgi:hypothetical protein
MRCLVPLLSVLLAAPVTLAQERLVPRATPKRPTTAPARPPFVVGVYMQPPDSFDVWRVRGINTLVGYESRGGAVSSDEWCGEAARRGFYYVRKPAADPAADAKDPFLLGWMHDDEPDVKKPPTDPAALQADYAAWKAAAPQVPVFVNFSGGYVLGGRVPKETYQQYLKAADWVGNDFYPVTGYNRPDWLWKVGAAVDQLRDWSGGKPQFAFIETSAQRLSWTPRNTRGVSVEELRALIWHSVIHGVKGIVYFPQQIGEGFRYDMTPPRVALEMGRQNKRLIELGAVWASEQNPAGVTVRAGAPMEVGWRVVGDKVYVIVLNFSDDTAKDVAIAVTGVAGPAKVLWEERAVAMNEGVIVETFGPYDVRVYEVGKGK